MEEVKRMKQQPGKDIVIFGSGSIVSTLAQSGLLDEYRIFVNPIVLGRGKPLFRDLKSRLKLRLLNSEVLRSGVVLLHYSLAKEGD